MYPYDQEKQIAPNQTLMPQTFPTYQGRPPAPEGVMGTINAALGGGPQQQWYAQQGLVNPQAAAAGQFFNNAKGWGQRGVGARNPIQAYQAAVAANANARYQRNQADIQNDPYWAYEEGKRRGHIPEEMSFFDFKDQASGRTRASNKTYAPTIGTGPDGRKVMVAPEYDIKTGQWKTTNMDLPEGWTPDKTLRDVDTGSGTYQIDPITGEPITYFPRYLKPGEEPDVRGRQELAVGQAQSDTAQYTSAIDRTWANREAYQMAQQFYDASQNTLQMIESGKVDTGVMDAFMYKLFGVGTEELGAMNAEQVQAVLNNLQITNLAPVTEQELKTVGGLWADIAKQREPNIGVLKRVIARTERLMERINADTKTQAERVKRYGGYEEYENLLGTNPFVRQQYEEDDPEIDI